MHASDPEDACGRRRGGGEAYATVAQRKERHPPEVGVAGSNPAGGTSGRMTSHGKPKSVGAFPPPWRMHGGVKRAPGRRAKAGAERRAAFLSGARIKGMESRRPAPSPSLSRPPPAPVAQGIERHPPKVGVAGSNPAEGTSGVTPPPE